jgi:hypothetical protein
LEAALGPLFPFSNYILTSFVFSFCEPSKI